MNTGHTILHLEQLVSKYVSGGVDSDTLGSVRTVRDATTLREGQAVTGYPSMVGGVTPDLSDLSRCNSDPLTLTPSGEFVLCHDPYCQKPVNIHQANRCVVTNAPYCDLCIEDHRDECGLCTLHLEQRRAEFQARLARIPEPEAI